MRTIHYMSMSADGRVLEADAANPIPPAILEHLMARVAEAGAVLVGRRTYDLLRGLGAIGAMPGVVVVLSQSLSGADDAQVAATPQAALDALAKAGVSSVVVAGGPQTYAAFRAAGALDELYLNIAPVLLGAGLQVSTEGSGFLPLELASSQTLAGGVVQLHYVRSG